MAKEGKIYYPYMEVARYIMAFAVIIAHYNTLAGHDLYFPISSFEGVGGFFALSGFLMYPSFNRSAGFLSYVKARGRRIMPPYLFAVIFFAIALAAVSTLPATSYFADAGFWKYLLANLTFLNWLHPDLPGVFQGSEYVYTAVNGSLWTMKVEWCLYLSVPIVMWIIGRLRWNKGYTAAAIIIVSIAYRYFFTRLYYATGSEIYDVLGRQFFGQLSYFYAGMMVYFNKEYFFTHRFAILAVSLVVCAIGRYVPDGNIFLMPIFLPTAILAFSMLKVKRVARRSEYNGSYNLYLIHFPIIQLSVCTGINSLPVWLSFGAVIGATVLIAIISARYFEPLILRGIRLRY